MSDDNCVPSPSPSKIDGCESDYDSSSSSSSLPSAEYDNLSVGDNDDQMSDREDTAGPRPGAVRSRAFMQALTNRLLLTQLDNDSTEGLNITARDSSEDEDVVALMSSTTLSLTPSLSLSSLARAEQLLQKSVPLINGGQHITLTKEDIERLRDSRLLHFLETNSATFVRCLRGPVGDASLDGNLDGEDGVERKVGEDASGRDADSCVTARDGDGVEYRVHVGRNGKLFVPVDTELEEGESTGEGEEAEDITDDEPPGNPTVPSASTEREQEHKLAAPEGQGKTKKAARRKAAPVVRGIGLTAEEDRRVSELLRTDFTAEVSPYAMNVEQSEAIDKRLKWFSDIRGPLKVRGAETRPDDDDDSDLMLSPQTNAISSSTLTVREIGNMYMQEVRRQRKLQSRINSINSQLEELQRL
ncbi:unnamed protein product, partial [Trypanosoma congolense IL3000]